ncbi:MAG: flagellar biosynthesis protein FlhB [Steroidobacteraceae bacterium]|nr:flagellar biosynthesis protein FlhB [Steroidobacteraceae bacterium]
MAEGRENDAEKTEEPTPKRLQDAREKGQIARSRELGTAAVMLSGSALLLLGGAPMGEALMRLMADGLQLDRETLLAADAMSRVLAAMSLDALLIVTPLLLAVLVASVLAPVMLGGFIFSMQALAPQLSRLNPVAGLGRIFGLHGLMELVKALLKLLLVGVIAAFVGYWLMPDTVWLGAMPAAPAIGRAAYILALSLLLMSAALIVVAAIDAPFQWWHHRRQLKMTREEVREELKDTDGKPEVKSKLRETQQKLARRRMMLDVPRADVVVANPTHFAVALKYDARRMRAPRVLAKGRDLVALEIRRLAEANRVPVFEAPPLARVLYGSTEVGREIPAGLYLAVAQVLSYVYQIRQLSPTLAARLRRPDPQVDAELRARYDRFADEVEG